ncbi:MAG TPA: AI-2E family transporter [Dietzia timorensis]|uniref:AI-2E family transporter n=1 Tax=Dietzia timorensis TaxID=499555 RepID=A0A921F2Y7_9ACTN|nr:AI-2E family transporter [Dietzia timorensis]HJE89863.1 AI-2E family transporter [Dietzia timorensis]
MPGTLSDRQSSQDDGARLHPRQGDLPYPIVVAAWWSLCLILIAGGVWVLAKIAGSVPVVLIPVAVAVLLSALLSPVTGFLTRRARFPRLAAALATVVALIAVIVGGISLAAQQVVSDLPQLQSKAMAGIDQIVVWLSDGPLHLDETRMNAVVDKIKTSTSEHSNELASGAFHAGGQVVDIFAGLIITLLALFFFLYEGRKIWTFFARLLPAAARDRVDAAARRGWVSLGAFTHTQALVALINAVCVGVGAAVLGLPFVLPIVIIVFIASFVPIVGAIVSGILPALIALVDNGIWHAVIMVAIVVVVHFVESHVLQPFLMGHAVALHPLAVIVIVASGTYLFGVAGALFAVPVAAALNAGIRYLLGNDMFPHLADGPPAGEKESDDDSEARPADSAQARSRPE